MSILSEGYSSYMSHFHKLQQRITTLNAAFNHVFNLAKDGIFIDCNLEEKMDEYPKYPCIYRYVNRTNIYDLLKIHHVSLDTVDRLLDYVTSKNALEIKTNIDNIPNDLTKIRNDIFLQYTFFSDVNDIFRLKQHFHDYSFLKTKYNYSNALSDPLYNDSHVNHSFIHLFLYDFIFRQQLKNNANFSNSLNVYCMENEIFSRTSIVDEFKTFIDTNKSTFLINIVNIIAQSLYKMSNTDDNLVNDIVNNIDSNIDTLKNAFESFMSESSVLPSSEISQYCLNSLYLTFGSKTIDVLFDNDTIFNQSYIQSIATDEDLVFNNFMNDVSSTNLKSYLYLTYLYKFWPIKFLNIYPIVMEKYVEDVIKPDSILAYSQKNLESILIQYISQSNVNYTELTNYFTSTVDNAYLHTLAQDEHVVKFGSFIYFIKLIDEFMSSTVYEDFVDNVYYDVFIILRDKGYIDHNFNWCKCKELFNLFFKSFIRSNISNNTIFENVSAEYETIFLNIINNNTGDPLYDVNISYSDSKLKSLYNSMVISHFEKIHGFIESMYLSRISDRVTYSMMSYFLVDQS
jgi:hypothetical protein